MTEMMEDQIPEEDEDMIDEAEAEAPEPEVEAVDPEAEAEARRYGWKPKEEFTLAPEGWVSADRFLELPSTQVKANRDLNRRLERELKERDEKISRMEAVTKTAIQRAREQERTAYEARLAEIEAAKRQAVEVGDTDRYDQLSDAQRKIKAPEIEPPEPQRPQEPPAEVKEYVDSAKWMKDRAAFEFAKDLIDQTPAVQRLPALEQIKWAERQLKEIGQFSQHFAAPAPVRSAPTTSKVDGGGMGMIGRRTKGASELPADVRKIGENFVKEGIFTDLEDYAKDYFAQGGT